MSEHFFFVYGTLKKGEPNHHVLIGDGDDAGIRFVGEGVTKDAFPLTIATKYNVPFLLLHDGKTGKNIIGEVYAVTEDTIPRLDKLESYPTVYDKRQVEVSLLSDTEDEVSLISDTEDGIEGDKTVVCWIYGLSRFNPNLVVKEPQLERWTNKPTGEHNLVYNFNTKTNTVDWDEFREELFGDQS